MIIVQQACCSEYMVERLIRWTNGLWYIRPHGVELSCQELLPRRWRKYAFAPPARLVVNRDVSDMAVNGGR